MQQGMLFTLLLSLSLWMTPASAVEMAPQERQQLLQDHQLQQKSGRTNGTGGGKMISMHSVLRYSV